MAKTLYSFPVESITGKLSSQQLFVAQQSHPQLGEKRYVKLQCFIVAQLLKALKTQKS